MMTNNGVLATNHIGKLKCGVFVLMVSVLYKCDKGSFSVAPVSKKREMFI
jgi:hypothetical protein